MEFEDILLDVGDNGKYQRNLILFFLSPAAAIIPWCTMSVLFMLSVPDHWCYVPEVASSNLSIAQQRSLISPPDNPTCDMYDVNYTNLLSSGMHTVPNDTATMPCTGGWQFDQTYYEYTAGTQYNLVCSNTHFISLIYTLGNVGSVIGTPIYGMLSDKIGRRIVFFITLVVTILTSLLCLFMPDFASYAVVRTINGTLMPTVFQIPYIIIIELVGPEIRTRMNGLVNCAWSIGFCILTVIAYGSRNWFILGLITSFAPVTFFGFWWFLPESPRWLVSQGKYEKAADVLVKIAESNQKSCERSVLLQKLEKLGEKMTKQKEVDGIENSATDVLKYPQLRKIFLIITICWTADITAYYGLQLNVTNLAGNEFLNYFLVTLVEIPGFLISWFVMERFGRRWCAVVSFILTGVICMLASIESDENAIACSIIGKFFASATFMVTYQQSSELYPTVIRSLGMGMSSTVAFIITFAVPYIVYLSMYGKWIPFVIIGCSSLVAAFSASFLPETLNENLPQTIADAEEFGRDQKYFSYNRKKQSAGRARAESLSVKFKYMDNFAEHVGNDLNYLEPIPSSVHMVRQLLEHQNEASSSKRSTDANIPNHRMPTTVHN